MVYGVPYRNVLHNFMGVVRMRQQWCPGRFFSTGSSLGTRLISIIYIKKIPSNPTRVFSVIVLLKSKLNRRKLLHEGN